MATFYANPYSYDLNGFYFSSVEDYNARLTTAQNATQNEFEHGIEFINGSDLERKIFDSCGSNICKFADVVEAVEGMEDNRLDIVIHLMNEQFCNDWEEAIELSESFMIFENENDFHEYLFESVCGDLPSSSPLVKYFDVEAYARDQILNSVFMELNGFYCTDPNQFGC